MHLASTTPQSAAGAQRDDFGAGAFFVATLQDDAKLVAIMGMRSANESGIESHRRYR